MAAFRKGPLPPPEEMQKYENIYPGATKLLFDNFVAQTNHRIELEKTVILGDNKRADKAQRNSFIIAMSILVLATILFFLGRNGYATGAVIAAIAPIIIAFITGSISRKKERETKQIK
ncbi:DUF2335 domain-containing protein [Treponema sp. R80B11-R83G3]